MTPKVSWLIALISAVGLTLQTPALTTTAPSAIVINTDGLTPSLKPPTLVGTYNNWAVLHLARRLVEEHFAGRLEAGLAKSWKVSNDFRVFTFTLAPHNRFCDGSPVTAASLVEWLQDARAVGKNGRLGAYFSIIDAVSAPTKDKLEIRLSSPLVNFLQILSDPIFSVYKPGTKREFPCFSGDYDAVRMNTNVLEIRRRADGQTFRFESMPFSEAVQRFKDGTLHILSSFSFSQPRQIRAVAKRTIEFADGKTYFLAFNTRVPRFNSIVSRKNFGAALYHSQLEAFLDKFQFVSSPSLLGPSYLVDRPIAVTSARPLKRRDRAPLRILIQKGHEMSLFIEAAFPPRLGSKRVIEADKNEFKQIVEAGNYDLILMGLGGITRDWDALTRYFDPTSFYNLAKVNNKTANRIISEARSSPINLVRIQKYKELLSLNEKNGWYISIAYQPMVFGLADTIKIADTRKLTPDTPFFNLNHVTSKTK